MTDAFVPAFTATGMIHARQVTPEAPATPEGVVAPVSDIARLGANLVDLGARHPRIGRPRAGK